MHNPIYFLDLKKQFSLIKGEVMQAIENTLEKGEYSGGKNIEEFEEAFSKLSNTKYAVALNNGTSALHLAMKAGNIGKGDEVIVPANTFIATAWAPGYMGAKPVFVDCNAEDWEIDSTKIEEKTSSKTKAIVGVHLYGQPCEIDSIKKIANEHNLLFIEDAAQAQGAEFKGRKVGGFGMAGCFSFYPTKNLGTYGEGGALSTDSEEIYSRVKKLRNNASIKKYEHDEVGFNMRMGCMEAAVLLVKMKYLDAWNNRRREIALKYQKYINNPLIQFQKQHAERTSVYHLFVITTEKREALISHLNHHNIFPGMHYPVPCHLQKAFKELGYKKGDFPNAEYLADHCLSIPMYPELTEEETDRVIEVLNKYK